MRRLAVIVALVGVTGLGFGVAFVVAAGTPTTSGIPICHWAGKPYAPGPPPQGASMQFVFQTPDTSSILNADGSPKHLDDIVPPFDYQIDGMGPTMHFAGTNMDTVYDGFTGAQLLAAGSPDCAPTGPPPGSVTTVTTTVTTTATQTTTTTLTAPADTVTGPAVTVTDPITVTISEPASTETQPGETTVVTVPPETTGLTTTVTTPARTVTLPASNDTTSTVVTVTVPGHVIHVPPHIIHTVLKRYGVEKKVIEMIIRACQTVGVGKG